MATNRYASLDGLRGIAAVIVMAYHYAQSLGGDPLHYGLLGVDLFFIISGYVIFLTLARRPNVFEFARNRFARLYPAYWVSLALAALVLVPQGKASLTQVAANVTMAQSFFRVPSVVNVYWTLGIELWFYVLIAAAFVTGAVRRIEWICLAWLACIGGMRTLELVYFAGQVPGLDAPVRTVMNLPLMSDYGHLFIIGMMIYRLRNGGGATSWFALFGGLLYGLLGRQDWAMVAPTIYFPALCLCAWLVWSATHADRNSPILASRTLVWIGGCSYSLYLIHNPIISAVQVVGAPSWLGVSVAAPLALASAWAMRRYIEIPGQRFFSSNWPFKTALQRASAV